MFNSGYRKEAVRQLEESVEKYNRINESLIKHSERLFQKRLELKDVISDAETYINSIANTPKEMNGEVKEIQVSLENYKEILDVVEKEVKKANFSSGGNAAAGIAAGAGVAAFGPTAAMGIATTFGVASTGTPIATLYGAAATKAALAWLGGGALVAGGGGTAAGTALLGLAGPIGWTIGGVSLVGSGLLMNGKNKKIAAEANQKTAEVTSQIRIQQGIIHEIKELLTLTDNNKENLEKRLQEARESFPLDYASMTGDQKYLLGAMVNLTLAAVQSLNKTVGTPS